MKLRQKLAMVLASATLITVAPVTTEAIQIQLNKASMILNNEFAFYNVEKGKHAINLKIYNNENDPIEGPEYFEIEGTDIKFVNDLYEETKGDDALPDGDDITDYDSDFNHSTQYALPDLSEDNDGDIVSNYGGQDDIPENDITDDYPNRLFSIDDEGNYISYVSLTYAQKKEYINSRDNNNADYVANNADEIDEIYLFKKYGSDIEDSIYVSMIPDGTNLKLSTDIKDTNPNDTSLISSEIITGLGFTAGDTGSRDNTFKFSNQTSSKDFPAQIYIKEFTVYSGDDDVLEVDLHQNLNQHLDSRLYVPMAFKVTGKAPSVKVVGNRIYVTKLSLSSNSTVSGDAISADVRSKGELSVDGKGKLGIFEIEENQEYVFTGSFATNFDDLDDWEKDFKEGTGGIAFHLQIDNKDLDFDLEAGDRYWDVSPIHGNEEPGELEKYISLTGGLRGKEEFVQVEVLAAQDNEMLIRIIDQTADESPRNYEGAIEFHNLPVDVASRKTELKLGDLEMKITQVEDLEFNEGDGDLGDWEYSDANELEETLVIATISDEDMAFTAKEEVEVIGGQESDKVEIELSALVGESINVKDDFYITISNGSIDTSGYDNENDYAADVNFESEIGSIDNNNEFFYYDDEWILDLDRLADAVDIDPDDKDQEDEWYEILSELTFELDIKADANASGDIKLNIESDNLKDDISIVIGTATKAFTIDAPKTTLDLGIREQQVGKIIIEETDEEMFRDGREIILGLEDLTIKDASVSTDRDSELDIDSDVKDGLLVLTINDESDGMGGTITIEDLEFDVWAGTPRGGYDLYIGGNALDWGKEDYDTFSDGKDEEDTVEKFQDDIKIITVEHYLDIGDGTVKDQLITIVDFRAGTTSVNGKQVPMTSKPYITPNGWSMIGVRDIAVFFGIEEEQIAYGHDENNVMTVTITNGKIGASGSTLVTVKNGSKILTVNGTPVIMGEPMTIGSDSRAYAPIRPIAEALGLSVNWDAATSRATFMN